MNYRNIAKNIIIAAILVTVGIVIGNYTATKHQQTHQKLALEEFSQTDLKEIETDLHNTIQEAKSLIHSTKNDKKVWPGLGESISHCIKQMQEMMDDPSMKDNPEHKKHLYQMYFHLASMLKDYRDLVGMIKSFDD